MAGTGPKLTVDIKDDNLTHWTVVNNCLDCKDPGTFDNVTDYWSGVLIHPLIRYREFANKLSYADGTHTVTLEGTDHKGKPWTEVIPVGDFDTGKWLYVVTGKKAGMSDPMAPECYSDLFGVPHRAADASKGGIILWQLRDSTVTIQTAHGAPEYHNQFSMEFPKGAVGFEVKLYYKLAVTRDYTGLGITVDRILIEGIGGGGPGDLMHPPHY